MRILVAGGGTGGHFFPALAVIEELLSRGINVLYFGTKGRIEWQEKGNLKCRALFLESKGFMGKGIRAFLSVPSLLKSTVRAVEAISEFSPDAAIVFGGYASFPAGVASYIKGIPLFIQEQNSVPGRTNRFLSRLSRMAFVGFPSSESYFYCPSIFTGNPIRKKIKETAKLEKSKILQKLNLSTEKKTLLILGGSQGAQWINKTFEKLSSYLSRYSSSLQIVHVCGKGKTGRLKEAYLSSGIEARVFEFYGRIWELYAVADAAVSRAGALTISELSIFGIPTLFIPFPYAVDDHQYYNAKFLADRGAALLYRENELSLEKLLETIELLLFDIMISVRLSERMREFSKPDATKEIVDRLVNYGKG